MRAIVLVVLAACGAPAKSSGSSTGGTETDLGSTPQTAPDAGAFTPRACVHDFKDPRPCSEECDRGIAASCIVLAAHSHDTWAVSLYERACELRDATACANAARFHASGKGVMPNRARQMELLAKACVLGQAESCSTPAKAFASGNGVPRDDRRAHDLWERGCGGGIEAACDALGDAGP
jgi:TPR repeat protein